MSYTYRVSTNGLKRIIALVSEIEQQEPGLSIAFSKELEDCLDLICQKPENGKVLFESKRGVLLPSFHYLLIYTIHPGRSEVVIHTIVNPDKASNFWLEE